MSAPGSLDTGAGGNRRAALGLATILAVVGLLVMAYTGAYRLLSSTDGDAVRAAFPTTARLERGDPVRMAGAQVGTVERLLPAGDGRGATVIMRLDRSARPLYADAEAAIKWRTLLGGSYVIELERGTPATGPLGTAVIPERRTRTQVEFEDFISFARGRPQRGLRTMPGQLARAFRDPHTFARLMATLADVAPAVEHGMRAMRGDQPGQDLRTLVSASARTVRALDTPTDDLRRALAGAAVTFETTAARASDLRRMIAAAPGVMRRTRTTLARLDTTLVLTEPLLERLRAPAAQLAATMSELRPTAVDADRLLRRSVPLLRSLRPAMSSLAAAARDGAPLLDEIAPALRRLDTAILPFLGEIDPQTDHSAAQMIGPALGALGGGIAGHFDRNGHFLRFPAALGPNSVQTVPCQPLLTNPDAGELAACESLQTALEEYLTYNPTGPSKGTTPPPEPRRRTRR